MLCAYCAAQNSVNDVTYLCGVCGLPQPLQSHENYFSVFGLPIRFTLNEVEFSRLQARFYEASRALHPDRFTRSVNSQAQQASVERMSFLNQAWMTLKNQSERRQYILKLEGIETTQVNKNSSQFHSMEFAEDWFELQDLFLEDPVQAKVKAQELKERIHAKQKELEESIHTFEFTWDTSHERSLLESIQTLSHQQNTLRSLERDLLQKGAAL